MRAPGVFFLSLALCLASAPTVSVEAHGGGLNSEGCHTIVSEADITVTAAARPG